METKSYYYKANDANASYLIENKLYEIIKTVKKKYEKIAIVCIGTDRCTGDSFGPLVGLNLSKYKDLNIDIYGTLHNPIHAKNIKECIDGIDKNNTLVIAIDACLGKESHISTIRIRNGSIKPGAGVGKSLPDVGDIAIEGIVNISGINSHLFLQTTRLSLVFDMAEVVSKALYHMLTLQQQVK